MSYLKYFFVPLEKFASFDFITIGFFASICNNFDSKKKKNKHEKKVKSLAGIELTYLNTWGWRSNQVSYGASWWEWPFSGNYGDLTLN